VTSWIYFIQNTFTKNLKIGQSYDPPGRRDAFKTGNDCPLEIIGVIPGDKKDEAALHRRFANLQIKNVGREWFYGTPELYAAIDLILNPRPVLFGREIKSVYLAGKITDNTWRQQLFKPGIDPRCEPCGPSCQPLVDSHHENWIHYDCIPVPGSKWDLDFTGPYWLDVSCGHGTPSRGAHAFGLRMPDDSGLSVNILETDGVYVRNKCLDGVARADLVFAWIDSLDCFGTIAEITWAYSLRTRSSSRLPVIVIASPLIPSPLEDRIAGEAWFVAGMADVIRYACTPLEAWERLWGQTVQPPGYIAVDCVYRSEKKIGVEFDREHDEDYYAGVPFGPDGIIEEPGL
jgi:hypothetical protein